MKKLVLLLAVVCSVSLFSCGNKAEQNTEATEDAAAVVEEGAAVVEETPCCDKAECPGDSCKNDSTCANCCAAEVVEGEAVVTE